MDESANRSILVIDDHAIVRQGVIAALSQIRSATITEAESYSGAVELSSRRKFDLAIIDFQLGGANGVDCAIALSMIQPEMRFILLTVDESWEVIKSAESAGFSAFISKGTPLIQIIATVERALQVREKFECIVGAITSPKDGERYSFLTPAEIEIMSHLRRGLTTHQIAQSRFCSEATVKSHLSSIYRKLGVRNRTSAIAAMEGLTTR